MGSDSVETCVTEIWRYPVKSLGGELLEAAQVEQDGLYGDHMWAVVDDETGTVASAKRTRLWGDLLLCRARLLPEQPAPAAPPGPADPARLVVTMPDGRESSGDDPVTIERLSALAGRPVRLQYASAGHNTMEMEWAPETQDGMEQAIEYSSALAAQDGNASVPVGAVPTGGGRSRYYDLAPLHIVTTSSVRQLVDDDTPIRDALRKYRPNLVVGDYDWDDGYVEDAWLGGRLQVGPLELRPTIPVGRCVMVTLAHGEAPRDPLVLRRIAGRHRLDVGYGTAPAPALGIYADVPRAGIVRIGDTVSPAPP